MPELQVSMTVSVLSSRTVKHCAIVLYRCHELSLQRIELANTSVSSLLTNQPVASESERARDPSQRAAVTSQINLSFWFVYRVPRHLIEFIPLDS